MQVQVMSTGKGKRDLTTLDLLSGGCRNILHRPVDLNLLPEDLHEPPPARHSLGNQSLCTIDKVKRALERAAHRSTQEAQLHKRPPPSAASSPSSSSSSSSRSSSVTTAPSTKRRRTEAPAADEEESDGCDDIAGAGVLVAAGCPACLSYVLTAKGNPRCPRCQSQVQPTAVPPRKGRRLGIDLNCAL